MKHERGFVPPKDSDNEVQKPYDIVHFGTKPLDLERAVSLHESALQKQLEVPHVTSLEEVEQVAFERALRKENMEQLIMQASRRMEGYEVTFSTLAADIYQQKKESDTAASLKMFKKDKYPSIGFVLEDDKGSYDARIHYKRVRKGLVGSSLEPTMFFQSDGASSTVVHFEKGKIKDVACEPEYEVEPRVIHSWSDASSIYHATRVFLDTPADPFSIYAKDRLWIGGIKDDGEAFDKSVRFNTWENRFVGYGSEDFSLSVPNYLSLMDNVLSTIAIKPAKTAL